MKKFFAEFKKFISRGNIVDMAVGVIIGGAFSTIVTALTNKIIMPFINLLLSLGGENGLEKAYTFLRTVYKTDGTIDLEKSIYIDWGSFITAIINFFIIAFVLFLILKAFMRADKMFKDAVEEAKDKSLRQEKREVRKLARENKISFKKAWANHIAEKEAAEKARIEAEEAAKQKVETTDDILKDIRLLLQANATTIEVTPVETNEEKPAKAKKSKK